MRRERQQRCNSVHEQVGQDSRDGLAQLVATAAQNCCALLKPASSIGIATLVLGTFWSAMATITYGPSPAVSDAMPAMARQNRAAPRLASPPLHGDVVEGQITPRPQHEAGSDGKAQRQRHCLRREPVPANPRPRRLPWSLLRSPRARAAVPPPASRGRRRAPRPIPSPRRFLHPLRAGWLRPRRKGLVADALQVRGETSAAYRPGGQWRPTTGSDQ